jgi:hypothetical protein
MVHNPANWSDFRTSEPSFTEAAPGSPGSGDARITGRAAG